MVLSTSWKAGFGGPVRVGAVTVLEQVGIEPVLSPQLGEYECFSVIGVLVCAVLLLQLGCCRFTSV